MATMALPIQTLSADIQVEAACAQKQIVSLHPRQHFNPFEWVKTRLINHYCSKLIAAEDRLISNLQEIDFNGFEPRQLEDLACDLDRIVSLTIAVIDKGNEISHEFGQAFRIKFFKLDQLASHIDSVAESLHVSADPHCVGLLAFAAVEEASKPAAA